MWNKYKYLLAYILPAAVFFGLYQGNIWTFSGVILTFIIIPAIELFIKGNPNNFEESQEQNLARNSYFDIILYLNIPILAGTIYYYLVHLHLYTSTEIIGATLSTGILVGSAINVAHELGHRELVFEKIFSKILLLPALYMHFYIEHNRGHHKNVGTAADPVSAKKGEILYVFWIKAIIGEYLSAWKLENDRLHKKGDSVVSIKNEMILFHFIQLTYLALCFQFFGYNGFIGAIAIALIGVLLLESINYIEHYGLRRNKLPNGFYEPVQPQHSWNSNHEVGRIFLYELTRHSDHHYKSTRKYQILRHFDKSPQLPMGYPAAILLALLPPIWFKIMDNTIDKLNIK
ncbi:MAG: alkane 1-monooxygenase [Saprospiraceae bacterium]